MSAIADNICRLCLNTDEDFKAIDDITREILDFLLLKMDLDISKDPLICKRCANISKKCYYFKLVCQNTEKYAIRKRKIDSDLKAIYKNVVDENYTFCGFCRVRLGGNNFISTRIFKEALFAKTLPVFMPETDFNIIDIPGICRACKENLECYVKLVQNCLAVEEKIKAYCLDEGTTKGEQVTLKDIVQSSATYSETPVVKQEFYEIEPDLIKTEILDIKVEPDIDENISDSPSDITLYAMCPFATNNENTPKDHMVTHRNTPKYKYAACKTKKRSLKVYKNTS